MSNDNRYETTGHVLRVFDTKKINDKFSKREFAVEVGDGKYKQSVLFEMAGDKASQLDDLGIGDKVKLTWNLRGREWRSQSGEVKYFTTLSVWKCEVVEKAQRSAPTTGGTGTDDLPFASCDLSFEPSPIARVLR